MDLSFNFSPYRRTSKIEHSISFLKSKRCSENLMPVKVPLGADTSNAMFDNSVASRVSRCLLQSCSPKTNFFQKSYSDTDNIPCTSKVMIPKLTSAAISFSQQTIVGGFVGSKNYAGRSIFGEHSQIWDVILCKFVELMSSGKDPVESHSKSSSEYNTKICDSSSQTSHLLYRDNLSNKISDNMSGLGHSSSISIPERLIVGCVDTSSDKAMKRIKSISSNECDSSKPFLRAAAEKPSSNLSTSSRGKYSSVVNGTYRNGINSVPPKSSSVENSPAREKPRNSCVVNVPLPLKQSYAEVAKTNPPKPMEPQSRVLCRETQNYKKKSMLSKFNSYNNKGGRREIKEKPTGMKMGDIMEDGDTRWNSKDKFKRRECQRNRPIPVMPQCARYSENENVARNSIEISFCVEPKVVPENGLCVEIVKEPINVCIRGRRPSESSVDSEDSFVVFAGSPESSISSSPYSTVCIPSSMELDEESETESISSSEYSSSEDDESEDMVCFLSSSPSAGNNILNWEFLNGRTYTIPKNASKELKKKKVHFAEGNALAVVRPMVTWSFAYREARRGNWEVYSRDRARFQCRINNLAPVLNLVLDPKHRKRIFESRFVER